MANWTLIQPEVIEKEITRANDRIVAKVRVRFTDDSTPPNTEEKDYLLSGSNIPAQLARLVHDTQQELQSADSVVVGAVTPQPPTQRSIAEQNYIEAVSNLSALVFLQSLGIANAAGQPMAAVLTNRRTALEAMIDTPLKLGAALPITPVR